MIGGGEGKNHDSILIYKEGNWGIDMARLLSSKGTRL